MKKIYISIYMSAKVCFWFLDIDLLSTQGSYASNVIAQEVALTMIEETMNKPRFILFGSFETRLIDNDV